MDNLKNKFAYISADGDGIGQKVARSELADDEQGLYAVSAKIKAGNDLLEDFAVQCGGQVISSGGDEVVLRVPIEKLVELESIRSDYAYVVGATLSVGVGESLSQASKALMVAKLSGKDQTLQYSPDVEQKYAQASQESNSETKKIGDAYMKNDPQVASQEQLAPESDVNNPNQDTSGEQPAVDDHSDCLYCQEAQEELEDDDCPYCAEDDQVEQEAGLDDCPYCQEAHAEDQHQHGDDCPHCQEMDAAKTQEQATQGAQDEIAPETAPAPTSDPAQDSEAAPDQGASIPVDGKPVELETGEHQSPAEVLEDFDAAHGEDPSQEGQTQTDQIGDVGIAEGGDGQEQNISRPDDFNGQIPQDSDDPNNTAGPDYGDMMQQDLSDNAGEMQKQKVGDTVRQALQSFKATKNYLEMAQQQAPEFYQANIAMIRAMIDMAKLLGFGGVQQPDQQAALGDQQQQMVEAQDPIESIPAGQTDWQNPFPTHPENGGDGSAGKSQGPSDNSDGLKGIGKLPTSATTKHVAKTPIPEGGVNAKGQKKITDPNGRVRFIDMKQGRVLSDQGVPVKA